MKDIKKIVIIQAGKNMYGGYTRKFLYTNITCPTIAAAIPENIEVQIIDMYVQDIDYETINADIALITTLTTFAETAFEVAKNLRRKGITVVGGGVHVKVMPEECQQHFDAIAIGEAELLIDDILNDFRNGQLKKIYETTELLDLTKCKIPRYDLLQLHKYNFIALVASKGCTFDCDFCSSRLITGAGFRHKSVEQIVNEIKYIQELHEKDSTVPETIFFVDSNLYTDRRFLKELLNALIPLKLQHWGLFASINIAYDDEILDLLQKANCEIIQIGFESINPASLKNNNKRQNNPAKYKEVLERLAARGIYGFGSFIFGFDDDGPDVFEETIKAVEEADFIVTGFSVLTPFPGTRVYERLYNEGRILHTNWSKYNMEDVVYKPKLLTEEELLNGIRYVRKRSTDPVRLLKCLEKFNKLSGKNPRLELSGKIAMILVYILMFFKLKPETKYFIRKLLAKGNLVNYFHAAHLISNIQSSRM